MKKAAVNVALTRVALLFIEALPRKEETSTLSMRVGHRNVISLRPHRHAR
jgi:hypothetical protein